MASEKPSSSASGAEKAGTSSVNHFQGLTPSTSSAKAYAP
jgi:hypothetical protein